MENETWETSKTKKILDLMKEQKLTWEMAKKVAEVKEQISKGWAHNGAGIR